MSIPVDLAELPEALTQRGLDCYLVTLGGERPHIVAVTVHWNGELLVAPAGGRTAANVVVRSGVSLLWPATADDPDRTLLVDGTARADSSQEVITIKPTSAVFDLAAGHTPVA